MNPIWLILGIVSFLVIAYICIQGARINFDDGEKRAAIFFGALFAGCMIGVGFFVGLLVLLPKVS